MHTLLPPSVLRLTETAALTLLADEVAHLFPTHALASPRAVGDAVQTFLANRLQNFELGKIGERRTWFDTVREYWPQHSANE